MHSTVSTGKPRRLTHGVASLAPGGDRPCPTSAQWALARRLAPAGADVIVGTHAHVLLGGGHLDNAYVDFGRGHFAFTARRPETVRTGVLMLTLAGRDVVGNRWIPGVIQDGVPVPLQGRAAGEARRHKEDLSSCTGLAPSERA